MKRSLMALGIMGLVYAVALSAANAAVLWQPDLTKDKLEGVNGLYRQGVTDAGDRSTDEVVGEGPFLIVTDNTSRAFQWVDGGVSGNIATGDGGDDTSADSPTAPYMLLTGDPKWADVAIQTKMVSFDENQGGIALILRAAPKTKFSDPDSHYEFLFLSGGEGGLQSQVRDGIPAQDDTGSIQPDGGNANITVRLLKVVNGKWTMLASVNQDKTSVHIPQINRLGVDHDTNKAADDDGNQDDDVLVGGYFRFVAKGDLLQGFVSLDGKTFDKVIEAHDGDLKAGLVGFSHYDYHPLFKEILVEDAP